MFTPNVIALALYYLVRVINILILIRIILPWINPNPYNPVVQFIYSVTEPILAPARQLINTVFGYKGFLDFSPILAMFVIQTVYSIILRLL
ncbi:YggT family protein [Alkaliphilus oremlandii]|uniref:YggT family protein n=1 Tax=Alkaliphilus oremlandii (strain OhILAs) TaxID=350688 RepID=A8MH66_ALKOO|nr:YggT family protein [Alkaliphilus oremlandii]ABW18953.1 protein of unknown function YGGT [Alkaliphilus oremlandii OhILAs]